MTWFDFSLFYVIFGAGVLVAMIAVAFLMIRSGRDRREDRSSRKSD